MLDLLAAPLACCLVLAGILCYFGLHVVSREIIFVDLALAQVAALGSAVALLFGFHLETAASYLFSLSFALLGAVLFAFSRFRDEKVPQEAIIGVVYGISSGVAVLVLDRAPHGHEALKQMLVGSILFVNWPAVLKTLLVCSLVGVVHFLVRKPLALMSLDPQGAMRKGLRVRLWDLLFYLTFGIVVTTSVPLAGVLLVFTYLIVPAVCAILFVRRPLPRLAIAWALGFLGSVFGLYFSARFDLPTGAAIVATFGGIVVLSVVAHSVLARVFHALPSLSPLSEPLSNSLSEEGDHSNAGQHG